MKTVMMTKFPIVILISLNFLKAIAKESGFFAAHPKYRNLLEKCGTPNLSRMLNGILMQHIRMCLPDIKFRIHSMVMDIQTNLDALGDSMVHIRMTVIT